MRQVIVLTKEEAAVAKAAISSDGRPLLCRVHFLPEGLCATDGHVMVIKPPSLRNRAAWPKTMTASFRLQPKDVVGGTVIEYEDDGTELTLKVAGKEVPHEPVSEDDARIFRTFPDRANEKRYDILLRREVLRALFNACPKATDFRFEIAAKDEMFRVRALYGDQFDENRDLMRDFEKTTIIAMPVIER